MKRDAIGVTDAISSEGLGRFPDLNVGEALQRLPGIQINREADSRNATINLRGLPGSFAAYTLNGADFAVPILNDSAPLGAFNSDLFSAIQVNKSPSAADVPGGLSGIIDLQIQPALARKDGGYLKMAMEYNELGGTTAPSLTGAIAKHFMNGRLAVFAVGAYREENFRRDAIIFNQYTTLSAATTPNFLARYADYYAPLPAAGTPCASGNVCVAGGTGARSTHGVFIQSQQRQLVQFNSGHMLAGTAGAEFAATDALKIGINGYYTNRDLNQAGTHLLIVDVRNARSIVNPTSDVFQLKDGNYYVSSYDYSNPTLNNSNREEPLTQQTMGAFANVDLSTDDWHASAVLALTRAKNFRLQTQVDYSTIAQPGAGNGRFGSFRSGDGDISQYLLTLNPAPGTQIASNATFTYPGTGQTVTANNGDQFILAGTDGTATSTLNTAKVDIERKLSSSWLSGIQIGLRAQRGEVVSRSFAVSPVGARVQNLNPNILMQSQYSTDFFGGTANGFLANWQAPDIPYIKSLLQPVTLQPGQLLTPGGWGNLTSSGNFRANNFTNRNQIVSGYAMAKLDLLIGSVRVRGHGGLRYEYTWNTINSLDTDRTGGLVNRTDKTEYGNLLPSVLIAADLTDKLVLRGAAYKAFVRPLPRQVSPVTSVSATAQGFNINLGSLDIQPYKADSYDVSLEWYNRPGGVIALAGYRKRITGLIGPITDRAQLCPSDASSLGLGTLTINGDTCFTSILVGGTPGVVTASGVTNNPNPITVNGLEFNIQQTFDFLPGALSGLGGGFNYSFTDVNGKTPAGDAATLPGVSRNNMNFVLFYERPAFGVRATYNYRDEYDLAAGNSFSGAARTVKARGQLDGSLTINVNERFSFGVDAFNILDAKRTEFQNEERMPRRVDYDGRTYVASVRATF